ncbi:hypothetical protein V1277_006292 [Bradyrhizobium sp. AZCC 1588]|uniref:hypothetical protein n=1 Tax=unclassified Bradyrhizobium TaxID=2631580 RepID=UPI002FF3E509
MPRDNLATPSSPSDFHRTRELDWWRNAPPGMPAAMAEECIARLKAGNTVRKLTSGLRQLGPGLVTYQRFKKHCELHPEWAAEAWRISKANTKAARGARFRAMTHCKHGHPLSGDNLYLYVAKGRKERKCLTCNKRLALSGRRVSEEQARRVVGALNEGRTIAEITKTGPSYILNSRALLLFRQKHPKFDQLVVRLSTANAKVHHAEARARRAQIVRAPSITDRAEDIFLMIISAVPTTLPAPIRDDVIGAMALEIVEGRLRRTDIRRRVGEYIIAQFRQFSKFGTISLDAQLYAEGRATLLDRLSSEASTGYWDPNMMASSGRRV